MSYIFDAHALAATQKKITALEQDIQRFTRACRSDWPRPVDYTNLIDAQFELKALKAGQANATFNPH